MSVWAGWQHQLLNAAGVPTGGDNDAFMTDWHQHATTNCTNNPVDISRNISGASACKLTSNPNRRARNYASHDQAAGQFNAQLRSGSFPHLLAALESGSPYNPTGSDKVGADLIAWGSAKFAAAYGAEINAQIGGGVLRGPHALGGWKALRKSINKGMPEALGYSQHVTTRTLRSLAKARKVRL
jgi:hypothetical protein